MKGKSAKGKAQRSDGKSDAINKAEFFLLIKIVKRNRKNFL
jgi:hypothetical protein